jgi:aerobic-type carbon monoxide dehydrogenase small subunit (CoxS/CutS family)
MTLAFEGPGEVDVAFRVNGQYVRLCVEPRRTLLSVLREELGLTGAKRGCGRGTCGACTVLLEGRPSLGEPPGWYAVYACMTLAVMCEGRSIRTVEGLAAGDVLHPVQEAFIEQDGYQCGFCTPGQVMSAVALLEKNPQPTESEIKSGMAGNLCRCGAYPNIVRAVQSAATKLAVAGGAADRREK